MYCSNRHWVRRPTTRALRYRIIEAAPTAMATATRPTWIAAAERRLAGAPDVVEEAPRAASAAVPPSPRVPETAAPVVTAAALEAEMGSSTSLFSPVSLPVQRAWGSSVPLLRGVPKAPRPMSLLWCAARREWQNKTMSTP